MTELDTHLSKIIPIKNASYDCGYIIKLYSFPEFLPKEYSGYGLDIRRDYNELYFESFFKYDSNIDRVIQYYKVEELQVRKISFDDFFEACSEEIKEYLIFNFDFFIPNIEK